MLSVIHVNDTNRCLLKNVSKNHAVYFTQLDVPWFSNQPLRAFSIKYVQEGCVHFQAKDQQLDLQAGNFLLMAKQPGVIAFNEGPVKTLCIDIDANSLERTYYTLRAKGKLKDLSWDPKLFEFPFFHDAIYSINDNRLGQLLQFFGQEINKKGPSAIQPIQCSLHQELLEQLLLLKEEHLNILSRIKRARESTKKETFNRLQKGKMYIDNNFLKNPQVIDVALNSHMSEFHFYRSFKDVFGVTPHQYILQKRLEYSRQILSSQKTIPIKDVAILCGFKDASTYTKAFGKFFGEPPKKYLTRVIQMGQREIVVSQNESEETLNHQHARPRYPFL